VGQLDEDRAENLGFGGIAEKLAPPLSCWLVMGTVGNIRLVKT
jgi:hypothetical protein